MAMSATDRALKTDPLAFLLRHSVVPPDAPKHLAWGQHLRAKGGSYDGHQEVGSNGLVAYGTLSPSVGYPGGYDMAAEYPIDQNRDRLHDFVPMYFLPWNSERLVGMQIPPKIPPRPDRPVATRARANATVTRPPLARDPDLFFTAAINGCSVFVAGDAGAPRVYHGGTQLEYADGAAAAKWRAMFREVEPQAFHSDGFTEVNKSHYIKARESKKIKDYTVSHLGTGKTVTVAKRDFVTDTSSAYKKYLKAAYTDAGGKRDIMIKRVLPYGCVFGVRDGAGQWAFYLQESAKVTYTIGRDDGTGYRAVATNAVAAVPLCVTRIFPGASGAGTVRHQTFQLLG